jgi:SNF2 family DNA or RNA helicase
MSAIKVSSGYGRLYVSGPGYKRLASLNGATENVKRSSMELSLTLNTLRQVRRHLGLTSEQLARFCTPEVMQWATAASRMEKLVKSTHDTVGEGYRLDLPWHDARADLLAPATADERYTYELDGNKYWRYRAPYDHQGVMATVACALDGLAFICDMGTGKTRAGIEAARYLLDTNQLDCILVVAPKSVAEMTWKQEVPLWAGLDVEVLTGMPVKQRREALRMWRATPSYPRFMVLNYDVLHPLKADLKAFLGSHRVGLLADEMHRIRNPGAKVTKAMLELAPLATWRLGMTGTPVLQGIQDVWSQWYLVDLGITFGSNYVQYKREFVTEDPYTFKVQAKAGMLEEVGNRMRKRGIRYSKADCMDLPPKVYESMTIDMTTEQARAYRDMEELLMAQLSALEDDDDSVATAANQLSMILRLTQITSGFVPNEEGVIHRFRPNPKLNVLEELIREQIGTHQMLVWARYTEDIASICSAVRDLDPVVIVGDGAISTIRQRGVDVPARSEAQQMFQSGERRLIVANPAAGGVGLNLWAASIAVYYSQGYSLEHRAQSEDRCHRGGSEVHNKVTYVDLQMRSTIDQVITQALLNKRSVAETVVDLRRHIGLQ